MNINLNKIKHFVLPNSRAALENTQRHEQSGGNAHWSSKKEHKSQQWNFWSFLQLNTAIKTCCLQCICVNSAAWCVWEVLRVIGNRGHVLVKTRLCVGEGLCLHSGALARLQRVWLWHYRTHLIGPIEMTWQPMLGKKRKGTTAYTSTDQEQREIEIEAVYWKCSRYTSLAWTVYILNVFHLNITGPWIVVVDTICYNMLLYLTKVRHFHFFRVLTCSSWIGYTV